MSKKLLSIIFLIFSLLLIFQNGYSQTEAVSYDIIRQKVEEIAERFEIEMDYADFVDVLYNFAQNPLNLNTASYDELQSMGLLSAIQISNLIDYRTKKGKLESIYELKDINGFDFLFAYELQLFVYVGQVSEKNRPSIKTMATKGKHDLITRYGQILENQKGFIDTTGSHYLGSPQKLYFRYRYTYSNILSLGLLGEKDSGEEFLKGNNPAGFDFYSAHLFFKNDKIIKTIAIGDYHLEFGQGLTLWSGLGFGKSVDALGTQKAARGLRPNTSANENLFFRGVAITIQPQINTNLTLFYSNKNLDAGITSDTTDLEESYFSSIQESGLHRTPTEINNKKSVNEQIFGGNLRYQKQQLSIGLTSYFTHFNQPLIKDPAPYQIYDFQGTTNINTGLDFSYSLGKFGLFGEAALSKNGGKAGIIGAIADINPRLKSSIVYRYFEPQYQVFYSASFAESAKTSNEKGLFWGIRAYLGSQSVINGYIDLFSFPWLKYRIDAPSQGHDFMVDFSNEVNRNFRFYLRFKSETKMLNQENIYLNILKPVEKQSFRINFSYSPHQEFKFQSRFEVAKYTHQPVNPSYGYLLFQDLKWDSKSKPVDISIRYAIFNTDSYDARIYAYESDVLYKFSIPGYFYVGQRYYLMFHWDISRKMDFWMRWAQTVYFDREINGSGNDEIDGNKKTELTIQMRFKF